MRILNIAEKDYFYFYNRQLDCSSFIWSKFRAVTDDQIVLLWPTSNEKKKIGAPKGKSPASYNLDDLELTEDEEEPKNVADVLPIQKSFDTTFTFEGTHKNALFTDKMKLQMQIYYTLVYFYYYIRCISLILILHNI